MATQTEYYEFNKPAGTDLVNPLVDTNPNWDKLDLDLHELDTRSIANATETVALGVHAISRINTNTKFIRWIATANFTAGDTFTVDGDVVAASTPAGATLETNAYVTGSVVLACLNADNSAMTIFVAGTTVASDSLKLGGELPSYYASAAALGSAETDIDNIQALQGNTSIASISDGTITGAISDLDSKVNPASITVTGDGVSTYKQKLDDLFSQIDMTKVSNNSYIKISDATIMRAVVVTATRIVFNFAYCRNTGLEINMIELQNNASSYYFRGISSSLQWSEVNFTNDVMPSTSFKFYY